MPEATDGGRTNGPDETEMEERAFRLEHETALDALRDRRGACPEVERLEALAAGGADAEVEAHVLLCPACDELLARLSGGPRPVDDVTWQRHARSLDRRPAPWSRAPHRPSRAVPYLAAAALVGLAAGGTLLLRHEPAPDLAPPVTPPHEAPASETRGAEILALEPAGRVRSVERFRWSLASPLRLTFRVQVRGGGVVVWSGVSDVPSLEATPALLEAVGTGRHEWRVEGLDRQGRTTASSPWVEFTVEPRDVP